MKSPLKSLSACALCLCAARMFAAPIPVMSAGKDADGITLRMKPGVMRLTVYSPRIIRVTYAARDTLPCLASLAVIAGPRNAAWKWSQTRDKIVLRTDEIQAQVDRATGAISFLDPSGRPILAESPDGGKSLTPNRIDGMDTLRSRDAFVLSPGEAIYGLGQHQDGLMNYRGAAIHLQQRNPGESAVPVLVSSRGYGVFWDNPAITDVNVGGGAGSAMPAGRRPLVAWTSDSAEAVDYYFMYGPALDKVVADYRYLTGAAPMFGRWAWGLWQCRNHYASQQEILEVAARYRRQHIPLDNVIQDWQYWTPNPWGSHRFDRERYPDVAGMMRELHAEHLHLIVSVWARFDLGCANWRQLRDAGALYSEVLHNVYPPGRGQWYDPFNPTGRRIYWDQISRALFSKGIDGWWLDASEPELSGDWGEFQDYRTADGPGFEVFNAYPLMHTTAVYRGQRAQSSEKRVFILTRSAYAGQQRNAAVTWSGDIRATWDVFARQIPAGLNFSLSGIPYWNTDTGGFVDHSAADPAYGPLFTRWFQFSAFCPMFRIHGNHDKAIYKFPPATEAILVRYDELRYHLIPYIYSVSWMVTHDGYTMMRPLVMDFREDAKVYDIGNQYMFGPALMVCPVTAAGATTRRVYLPAGASWTDFWTGRTLRGGRTIDAAAPLETLPLFVRAGSIIPYGPAVTCTAEGDNPIELRVYRGADGRFTLYEDEGDNYDYESGEYATIPISWNEAANTLEIGRRSGRFPGMLKERTFDIVWVSRDRGTGVANTERPDAVVHYRGAEVKVSGPR